MSGYNPSNIFARARLGETRHVGEYSLVKAGEYPNILGIDNVRGQIS